MSNISALVELLRGEANSLQSEDQLHEDEIYNTFERSIQQSMVEIKNGANSDDFFNLVISNFMINGTKKGYSKDEIINFVSMIMEFNSEDKSDVDEDDEDYYEYE